MKRRKYIRVALGLCLIGAACLAVSYFWAGGTRRAFAEMLMELDQRNRFEERAFETDEAVTRLTVSDERYGVVILPSEDGKTRARYTESECERYDVRFEGGALFIEYKGEFPWLWALSLSLKELDRTVRIEVPADTLRALSVSCVSGDAEVSRLAVDGDASLSTVNGKVSAVELSVAGDLTAENTNGATYAARCETEGSIYAHTVNGRASVDACRAAGDIRASSVNGEIAMYDTAADGALSAGTVNGSILLSRVDGASVDLSALNGNIDAELAGSADEYDWNGSADEYDQSGETHDSDAEGGVARKPMRVYVDIGSARVSFAK